ncbi:MAG: hypothetical protein ABGX28_04770 [Methylococcales bacterium]
MHQSHTLEKMMTNSEFFTLSGFEAHRNKRATIFAKASFGHPSPSKRQKSRGN